MWRPGLGVSGACTTGGGWQNGARRCSQPGPQTHDCVTLGGKGALADVTKDLEWKRALRYPVGPICHQGTKTRGQSRRDAQVLALKAEEGHL